MTDTNVKPANAKVIPVEDRIFRAKRSLQEAVNAMRTSKESAKPVGARAVGRANKLLADACKLLDDIFDDHKVLDGIILKLKEDHPREIAELRRLIEEREGQYNALRDEVTESCNAQHRAMRDNANTVSDLQSKLLLAEEHVKKAQNTGMELAEELDHEIAKHKETQSRLDSLQINYCECLERLFKAHIMKPDELYRVAEKFLPQVTIAGDDGFYQVNPDWHTKVVVDLELRLDTIEHRRKYERVLLASVCALYTRNFQTEERKEITTMVAWDTFFAESLVSPIFSVGTVELFPKPKSGAGYKDVLSQYNGMEDLAVVGDHCGDQTTPTPGDVKAPSEEPSIFAKDQTWVDRGLFTISEEWVSWAYNNAGIPNEVEDLYKRNAFRTVLSERVRWLVKTESAPVVVIDWDGAAIMRSLNFSCLMLSDLATSFVGKHPAEVVENNFYL